MTDLVDSQVAVQTAIFTALSSASYFTTNSITVYDMVPKGTAVPYITIGDMTVVDDSTVGIGGQVITLNVHSWDQNLSSLRLKQTMAAVIATLQDENFSLGAGFALINLRFVNSQTFKDPDGLTLHGVQKFRIVVQNV
jgi:hypothetical protein